jgi:hypothetical protein
MNLPAFPEFTWDDYFWVTTAQLPAWSGYQIRNGPYGALSGPGLSDGTVKLLFAPEGREDGPLTEQEIGLVRWVTENQAAVHDAMLQSLFDEYPRLRDEFLDYFIDEDMAKQCLPEVKSPAELKALLGIVSVNVHQIAGAEPYIGVELGCTWDEEHGVGVLLHGAKPLEVGGADTAILLWIAKKYAKES